MKKADLAGSGNVARLLIGKQVKQGNCKCMWQQQKVLAEAAFVSHPGPASSQKLVTKSTAMWTEQDARVECGQQSVCLA